MKIEIVIDKNGDILASLDNTFVVDLLSEINPSESKKLKKEFQSKPFDLNNTRDYKLFCG